jgi:hypothetical protein
MYHWTIEVYVVNNVSKTEQYGKALAGGKISTGEMFCNKR